MESMRAQKSITGMLTSQYSQHCRVTALESDVIIQDLLQYLPSKESISIIFSRFTGFLHSAQL